MSLPVAAVAGLAVLAGPAVMASAATTSPAGTDVRAVADQAGDFALCSDGGYGSFAVFPDRGGWSTVVIPNGVCLRYAMGGNINEEVDVYDADNGQYIGSTIYNGLVGETIVTIPGPSFYAYNG